MSGSLFQRVGAALQNDLALEVFLVVFSLDPETLSLHGVYSVVVIVREKRIDIVSICTLQKKKKRRKRHKLIQFHKIINNACPDYLSDLLLPLASTANLYHLVASLSFLFFFSFFNGCPTDDL